MGECWLLTPKSPAKKCNLGIARLHASDVH